METNISPFFKTALKRDDLILADTSFVINLVGDNDNDKVQEECLDFIYTAQQRGAYFCISPIVEQELVSIKQKDMLKKHFGNLSWVESDIKYWKQINPQEHNAAISSSIEYKDSTIAAIKEFHSFIPDMITSYAPYHRLAQELMIKYNIFGYNDALQIAISLHEGIPFFATTDSDFFEVSADNLTIAVNDNTYHKYTNWR